MVINCEKIQWGVKIPSDMRTISVSAINNNFKEYEGKTVVIEGWIYKSFPYPVGVYLNDRTVDIAVYGFLRETSSFEKKILEPMRYGYEAKKFVRIMGIVIDANIKYPLARLILSPSPAIIATGVELK